MSDDALAALVVGYLAGAAITLLTTDVPEHERFLFRRLALWPLYWGYVLIKMGFMLLHEPRR
jgi:hypothetical protein